MFKGFFFSSTSQSLPDQAAISKASYSYLFTTLRYVGTALILWILLNILDQPLQNLQLVCCRLSAPTSDNSFSFFCQYLKESIEHMFNKFHGVRHYLLYNEIRVKQDNIWNNKTKLEFQRKWSYPPFWFYKFVIQLWAYRDVDDTALILVYIYVYYICIVYNIYNI